MPEIREAREEDRDSAIRVLWKAFESSESYENVLKKDWVKQWNQPEKEDWAYIGVDGDKVIANLAFFASENNIIRGKSVRFAGVWAVATEPSYRRSGLVRGLFDNAFPRMKKEGCVLSILDPFYRPFYEKFGYAIAERRVKHVFKKEHLRVGNSSPEITCREADSDDDITKMQQVEKSMARYGSRFFSFERDAKEIIKKGNFYIFEKNGEAVGTVRFRFLEPHQDPDHEAFYLTVLNTRYTSDEIFPSIVEQVRNHAVNVERISWYTDYETPIRHFFSDIHDAKSYQIGSMMMRVIDFEGYCRSIGIPRTATKSVTLELNDDQCPWNNGIYTITPNDGVLSVERNSEEPDIRLTPYQLSEIISGISPPHLLWSFREIECSEDTAWRLESIFPEDVFYSYVRF
ncbi:MAG: enhanced intracellular survival protein Eis [Candidatus Thorarchaeota archaeon]